MEKRERPEFCTDEHLEYLDAVSYDPVAAVKRLMGEQYDRLDGALQLDQELALSFSIALRVMEREVRLHEVRRLERDFKARGLYGTTILTSRVKELRR